MSARRRYNFAEKFAAIRSDLAEIQRTLNEGVTILSALNVKIRKLHPDAVTPVYAKPGDSGFDLVAVEDVIIRPSETALVPTGLAFGIPQGYELQVRPRSGISLRTKLRVANAPGTVDSGFRGEVKVIVDNVGQTEYDGAEEGGLFANLGHKPESIDGVPYGESYAYEGGTYIVRKGDKIAQGVIAPIARAEFTEVGALSDTERGTGGFGSTGTNAILSNGGRGA